MRFKAFRIRVANRRFRLEGLVNPWVLLATGEIKHIDEADLHPPTTGTRTLGDAVTTQAGNAGTVVSNLNDLTLADIKTLVRQGNNTVAELSKDLNEKLLLNLLNKTKSADTLLHFLTYAGGPDQAQQLLKVLNVAGNGDPNRLRNLLRVANGSPDDFKRLADQTIALSNRKVLQEIPSVPSAVQRYSDGAKMQHFIDGHTFEYLKIEGRLGKASTTLWPRGTTPNDIKKYLNEAISNLAKDDRLPTPYNPATVRISDGVEVQVGLTGTKTYGQFFPTSNNSSKFETITKTEMSAIWDILKP